MGYQLISVYHMTGEWGVRAGESRMTSFPTGIHPCADGHMALMLLEKSQWQGFVKAMGSPEWAANPMFDIPMWNLREYSQEIRLLAEPWFEERTKKELFEVLQANKVPSGPVNNAEDVANDPHLNARGFLRRVRPARGRPRQGPGAALRDEQDAVVAAPPRARPRRAQRRDSRRALRLQRRGPHRPAANRDHLAGPPPTEPIECPSYRLSNLRVANFGWVWVAPLMGHILADMGAEVFKVETRNRPDVIRILPPYMDEELAKEKGAAAPGEPLRGEHFPQLPRHHPGHLDRVRGQRLAKELIKSCDVVIENFSPKVMGKFGMSYEELRAPAPRPHHDLRLGGG